VRITVNENGNFASALADVRALRSCLRARHRERQSQRQPQGQTQRQMDRIIAKQEHHENGEKRATKGIERLKEKDNCGDDAE
jgi:hypothetical protein